MATVWIEKIWNISSHELTIYQNDGTWRPWVDERSKSYASDEPIVISPGEALTTQHFFMPWADWGRTLVTGPEGSIEFVIGPTSFSSLDCLRGFDVKDRREVMTVEMGPRGSWWSSSVALHLVLADDGMRWSIWSATKVGNDVLNKAGEMLEFVAKELIKVLTGKIGK